MFAVPRVMNGRAKSPSIQTVLVNYTYCLITMFTSRYVETSCQTTDTRLKKKKIGFEINPVGKKPLTITRTRQDKKYNYYHIFVV